MAAIDPVPGCYPEGKPSLRSEPSTIVVTIACCIMLVIWAVCLVEGFYWAIKTGNGEVIFMLLLLLSPFLPWLFVNLVVPGIAWAFDKLCKFIMGD
jgi:hypothetical protein